MTLRRTLFQITLFALLSAFAALPAFSRTVRVGCFKDDVLYQTQGADRNASYLTDFLSTINRYNDWQFEYVYINFDEAAAALSSGKIDMLPFCGRGLGDEGDFLFSDIPSAVGSLCLAGMREPDMKNLRIGVTDHAPQEMRGQIEYYAKQQGIRYILKEYPDSERLLQAIQDGRLDVFSTIDLGMPKGLHVIASITPIFFYITVRRSDAELYMQLNQALSLTFNLTPDFLNILRLRYIPEADEGVFNFNYREQQYLGTATTIRIAMLENQPPYSYLEKGKPAGILIDQVKTIFSRSYLMYEFVPVKSYREAVEMVRKGEADVIYALADTLSDIDAKYLKVTNSIFRQRQQVATHFGGVIPGTCTFIGVRAYQYSSAFMQAKYRPTDMVWYDTPEECLAAVKRTKNSFTLLPDMELKVYEQNHLFPGIKIEDEGYTNMLGIGISRRIPPELCSILDKTIHKLSLSLMEDYLAENIAVGSGMQALIKQHPFFSLGVLIAFLFLLTIAIFLTIYNTTKRRKDKQIAQAMNLANRDAMTGLYNHIAYEKLVEKSLSHQAAEEKSALVMIDIDNFKRINDTLGHGTGDVVIVTLANILFSTFRQGDLKCRMGGDEFSVFMKDVADRTGVEHKLTFLMQEVERTFDKMSLAVPVTCSVGAVICSGTYIDGFEPLYAEADKALYTVKEGGKNSFAIMPDEIVGKAPEEQDLRRE